MTALLDVNVLVALFDPAHIHHETAHGWFQAHQGGWASCPLTENGFVRVLANQNYPGNRTTAADAIQRLRLFQSETPHSFWADTVSLCTPGLIDPRHIQGHRQISDTYLLALAVHHQGQLATLDQGLTTRTVTSAKAANLLIIE